MEKIISTDFLVIGSGIAGLTFAIEVAKYGTVAIVTKKDDAESNTNYAQGGIASVLSSEDSFESHINDTLNAGDGLCNRDAVKIMVEEGPNNIKKLIELGVNFTRDKNKKLHLGREGGHSRNRIVHAKDLTGREVEQVLLSTVKNHPNIEIYENHIAIDIITEHHLIGGFDYSLDDIHCWGAYVLDIERGEVIRFSSKVTLLSTGGVGQVYLHTSNPKIATGDGIAMAFRAGGKIANVEFMQFHPTTLYLPDSDSFLISEAIRGAGAELLTVEKKEFMKKYDKRGSLAPRDIVARAIDRELKKSGSSYVYLDVRRIGKKRIIEEFPHIYNKCLSYKIDITEELVPVVPAAHYMCGGVKTDLWGRTSIHQLYACGEVACTGVHGANRLASNSLLEALVFSRRASLRAVEEAKSIRRIPSAPEWNAEGTFNQEEWVLISHDRAEIQRLMWDYVGVVRSNLRLKRAERRIELIAKEVEDFYKKTRVTEKLIELRNIATSALLIIKSALRRKESRGLHYNSDYPFKDDKKWKKDNIIINKSGRISYC
ncbi:L-aspartate oxidase [candidate division KSB1 bacterium]|nr:MAG: L-aspartate oxidase [candidate division KSB1 bacterium]